MKRKHEAVTVFGQHTVIEGHMCLYSLINESFFFKPFSCLLLRP